MMLNVTPLIRQAADFVEGRTGLAVGKQRHDFGLILHDLARTHTRGALDTYLRHLRDARDDDPLWQALIDALTIGETYFFRDLAHFRLLRQKLLPDLMARRRQDGRQALNLWSAGCATGEEPYSLAITLHALLPDLPQWTLRLYGTDINARALATAARAVYRPWSFRHNDGDFQGRCFTRLEAGWKLRDDVRALVTFRQANLLNGAPLPQFDVIFCRNVLIYMDVPHVEALESLLFDALSPGGWLFLGQAEAVRFQRERWHAHVFPGVVVYQKPAAPVSGYHRHTEPPISILPLPPSPAAEATASTYADAVRAVQRDDAANAERLLAEVLAQQPDHAQAHTLLASLFANRHALPEAHAHVDSALRLSPLLADAHYVRAVLWLAEDEHEMAQKALQSALYCQPEHPLASFLVGTLHARMGDLQRARRAWEKAQRAVSAFSPDAPFSDLSDLDAAGFSALLAGYLEEA